MTRPFARQPIVSMLRRRRHYRALPILFTLVGAVACGRDNPVAPSSSPKAPVLDYTVPSAVLSYATPYAQAASIVSSYESNARSMGTEVGVTPPSLAVGVSMTRVSTSGIAAAQAKGGGGQTPPPPIGFYLPNGCKKDYVDCVYDCLYTRAQFQSAAGDFWRADDDYWQHLLTGRDYLNHLPGGPQDQMYSAFNKMGQMVRQYRAQDCSHYL